MGVTETDKAPLAAAFLCLAPSVWDCVSATMRMYSSRKRAIVEVRVEQNCAELNRSGGCTRASRRRCCHNPVAGTVYARYWF